MEKPHSCLFLWESDQLIMSVDDLLKNKLFNSINNSIKKAFQQQHVSQLQAYYSSMTPYAGLTPLQTH